MEHVGKRIGEWTKRIRVHHVLRVLFITLLFVFAILPLFFLLGNISGEDLGFIFSDASFYDAIGSSFLYTTVATVITVILGLGAAYLLNASSFKHKKLFAVLLTLPMLVPTLSIGLGIRVMGGEKGFLDHLFHFSGSFLGMPGLILGSVIVAFPPTFLVLYDAMCYENKQPYDAATTMGIGKFSQFFHITLPYLVKPLIVAFLACFTLIFSDYGIPMEVAGKTHTLPMYLYEQASSNFKYGRAAFVGILLLAPAVVSFITDIFLKEGKGEEKQKQYLKNGTAFNAVAGIILGILCFLLFVPQLSFVSLAFMKGYPNNISFTFENVASIFDSIHGVGLPTYIFNSIFISLMVGVFGVVLAFVSAYLTARVKGKAGKVLNFLAVSSIAVPGIVLGIGYIFLFKDTNGFFYGTFAIIIVANIVHFFGNPYIMAKNCLSKINKDYEIIGDTLGLNRGRIFFRVLVPSSLGTIIEMFSYFFLNSMITISAVSFLCTYQTQPLSILITTYERTGNYEMQAVISFIIIVLNIVFKCLLGVVNYVLVTRLNKRKEKEYMELTRHQFSLLTYLEKHGKGKYSQRLLSNELTISLGTINREINLCYESGFIQSNAAGEIEITEKGLQVLEPYRVRKAIIVAAGFGSRMAPVTLDTPKPLIKVNGVRIVETLLDALVAKGITNIALVRGYKKDQFDVLLKKYPTIHFIDNDEFNVSNNISSVMRAIDYVDRCYICEADLIVSNPDIINKYEYTTNYLGIRVAETDDWCFTKKNGYIRTYRIGGENCHQAIGISYWNEADSKKLREDLTKVYHSRGGKENFWEAAPLRIYAKDFKIEVRDCQRSDVVEIDNFSELVSLDPSYENYPGHNEF